jgi:Cdc6-like AAA superfamily ATPase
MAKDSAVLEEVQEIYMLSTLAKPDFILHPNKFYQVGDEPGLTQELVNELIANKFGERGPDARKRIEAEKAAAKAAREKAQGRR